MMTRLQLLSTFKTTPSTQHSVCICTYLTSDFRLNIDYNINGGITWRREIVNFMFKYIAGTMSQDERSQRIMHEILFFAAIRNMEFISLSYRVYIVIFIIIFIIIYCYIYYYGQLNYTW